MTSSRLASRIYPRIAQHPASAVAPVLQFVNKSAANAKPGRARLQGRICYLRATQSLLPNLHANLQTYGLQVDHFSDAKLALNALSHQHYDLVLTELNLHHKNHNGKEFIQSISGLTKSPSAKPHILLAVAHEDSEMLSQFLDARAQDYLACDWEEEQLYSRLAAHCEVLAPKITIHHRSLTNAAPNPNKLNKMTPPSRTDRIGAGLVDWLVKHPWWSMFYATLLLVLLSAGVINLSVSTDFRVFFGKDNPELVAFNTIERTYAKNFNVLFVVSAREGDLFTEPSLHAIKALTEASWQVPFATRVDSITNFQHTWSQGDELIVQELVDQAKHLSSEQLNWIKQVALTEPLLINRLISEHGNVAGVNVTIEESNPANRKSGDVATFSRQLMREFQLRYPNLEFRLTGMAMMDDAFYSATVGDMQLLIPAMYLLVVLMVGVMLRSLVAILATTAVIAAASASAMGYAGWLGIQLTAPSSLAPTIILTLAVANSMHLLTVFFNHLALKCSKRDAVIASLNLNLKPVVITSLTTAIGFFSMNFSDSPPFHDLGNLVAIGVLAACIFSLTLLPAILLILPVKARRQQGIQHALMLKLGRWVVQHYRFLLLAMIVLVPIVASGIKSIEVDDNFVEYFDQRYQFRLDTDYVQQHLTGLANIEFSIAAEGPGGVNEPFYLHQLERFANWLRKQPGVTHVNTIVDTMKRLNMNMHGNDPRYYRIPEQRNLAAQYLFLYELSLPLGLDLNNQINLDKSASRVTLTLDNLTNKQQLALEASAAQWLTRNTPSYMHTRGASPTIMFANISQRNIQAMFTGTSIALILISVILIFTFGSFRVGLLSLVPNLVPAIMAFGLWGLLVGKVGLAISVVSAVALGIIVDDTVHFLSKYLSARRTQSLSVGDAIIATFVQVGPALLSTSVVLVCGFLAISLSGFSVSADMGLLTAITMILALCADLLFLPPLLIWIERSQNRTSVASAQ